MAQIVTNKAIPVRCNKTAIQEGGSRANFVLPSGEIWLVDSTNVSKTNGVGLYDSYIIGDGSTTASNLTIHKIDEGGGASITIDSVPTENSTNAVSSGGVYDAIQQSSGVVTETDPVFTASPAYGITSSDIDNWNNAVVLGDDDGEAVSANFDPQADTVWNIPQTLGSSQQAQARANIGVVDVSGTNDGTNWTSITIGSTTKAIPSGGGGGGSGEANVIESISINGTTQTVTSKNVDLPVPISSDVYSIVKITQAAYDLLDPPSSTTLYIITTS